MVRTRDRPDLLELTLRSILAQCDVDLEVVVIDDSSTIPLTLHDVTDPRVRVLRNEQSLGVSAARNRSAAAARAMDRVLRR